MGFFFILFVLGPIFLLYVGNKVLALILSITLAVYSLVKMHNKQPTGKIFTVITVVLIILKVFALPIDVIPYITTSKTVVYSTKLNSGNYAVAEEPNAKSLTYKNKEYVDITWELRTALGDNHYSCDLENSKMFKETTQVLFEDQADFITLLFSSGSGMSSVLYQKKDAPDDRIVYLNSLDISEEIWCLKEYAESALQTYTDKENLDFYIVYEKDGIEKRQKIDGDTYDKIKKCEEKEDERDASYFPVPNNNSTYARLEVHSKDKRVYAKSIYSSLKNMDGKLYYNYDLMGNDCLRYLDVELD